VPLLSERGDRVVARIDAAIRRARAQGLDVREPGALAAGDVEHRMERAAQEVLRLRHRERHLPPHLGFGGDAAAAAIPLVEIGPVVAFHLRGRNSPVSRYSLGILWKSVTPSR